MFLEKGGLIDNFVKVCVDKDSSGKRSDMVQKYSITKVPTLIVEDGRKLIGLSAINWVEEKISQNSEDRTSKPPPKKNQGPDSFVIGGGEFSGSSIQEVSTMRIETPGADNENLSKALPANTKDRKMKRDKLKTKQTENDYNRLIQERNFLDNELKTTQQNVF
jgi:hypothetical protein